MIKESGAWQRQYIDSKGKCAICNESSNHIRANNSNMRNFKVSNHIPIHPLIKHFKPLNCIICLEDITDIIEQKTIQIPCNHAFCKQCWFEYLKQSLTNGKVSNIIT